jgi:hypothetical protein
MAFPESAFLLEDYQIKILHFLVDAETPVQAQTLSYCNLSRDQEGLGSRVQ